MGRGKRVALLAWMCAVTCLAAEAEVPARAPVHIDVSKGPAAFVNEYHLFKDAVRQIPNEGVVPYDLNTPHFADYATLYHFVWLPPGTAIQYQPDHYTLDYPNGAAVILTLAYLNDIRDPAQGQRLVETRLLVYTEGIWKAFQYVWNEDMTDARLALAGGTVPVRWIHYDGEVRSMNVLVPNTNQCKMCHELEGTFVPLGPMEARHLNKDYAYAEGNENQLAHWARMGLLKDLPDDTSLIPRTAVWNDPATGDVATRARAYLDMNCSSCHQPGGLAYTSGLDLSSDQENPVRFGVFKSPVAAGRGVGTGRFGIQPGNPEGSILYHRMGAVDPGVRMPVVGRSVPHEEGLKLVDEWISTMTYPELTAEQEEADAARMRQLERIAVPPSFATSANK